MSQNNPPRNLQLNRRLKIIIKKFGQITTFALALLALNLPAAHADQLSNILESRQDQDQRAGKLPALWFRRQGPKARRL